MVIVLLGRGRARPAKVIYNSLGAPVPYTLRLWCVMYIDAIGAKTYLTHLSSPAILYKGITNPYHYLPIAMTKP